ncbi:TIGR02117 family protein [Marinobacter sp. SS21]|uniref:TIGR02117 family protein n=1 Tax=Marinobacter sp. SS21 TaxID=2979460 RepID=UPI00232E3157|nr:TIGR02117 family protein [Marinobacter sp. SS21]MDC0663557.1 TIGR02117 family protein [Marinobacter sp. SS21]
MKAAGLLFVLVALYGCSGKPYVLEPEINADSSRTTRLYVVGHGWHVGLVIAADELNPMIPELKARFGGAEYYELGWGDEGFYQAREITTGVTLQAIFWSRGAVMHVAALPVSPDRYFPGSDVVDTCLNPEQTDSLKRYLANSFTQDAGNNLVELKRGVYGDSQFYEGEGRYHLLNTSNKWAAKALKSGGMEISPTLKLTASSVMAFVKANRKACTL